MLRLLGSALMIASLCLVGSAQAQDSKEEKKPGEKKKFEGKFDTSKFFGLLDANSDKKVSKDEIKAFVEKFKEKLGDKADKIAPIIETVFGKMDADNDGFISEDEFKKGSEQGLGFLKGLKGKKKKTDN